MSKIRRFMLMDQEEAPWDDLMLLDVLHAEPGAGGLVIWATIADGDDFDDEDDEDAWDADEAE